MINVPSVSDLLVYVLLQLTNADVVHGPLPFTLLELLNEFLDMGGHIITQIFLSRTPEHTFFFDLLKVAEHIKVPEFQILVPVFSVQKIILMVICICSHRVGQYL